MKAFSLPPAIKPVGSSRRITELLLIVLMALLCSPGASAEDTVSKETPLFSNSDLQQYRGRRSPTAAPRQETGRTRSQKEDIARNESKEDKERQYWCRRAKPYRKALNKALDDLSEAERELSEERARNIYGNKRLASLETRVDRLKRKSRAAEEELFEIEDEAYRRGVPAGWLRCQFE